MTVAELIEQLRKYPSDAEVVYSDGMGFSTDVTDVDFGRGYTIFGYDSKKEVTISWEVLDD